MSSVRRAATFCDLDIMVWPSPPRAAVAALALREG
jgi:hypothetical protein